MKSELLKLLIQHQGTVVSGEAIARSLHITRAAVWKSIRVLIEEGYDIQRFPGKGYALSLTDDLLSEAAIQKHLPIDHDFHIDIRKTVTSTNDAAKELAFHNAPERTVVISEHQSKGKGRKGKQFYSPKQAGLYMSLVLRPACSIHESLLITAAAAVAVRRAIKDVCGIDADIKWVNDVMIDNHKICGILCEGNLETDAARFEWAVLGIGINCWEETFPQDLEPIAAALHTYTDQPFTRAALAASVLTHFDACYQHLDQREYLDEYRQASILLNKRIIIYEGNHIMEGTAVGIDEQANLLVQMKNRTQKVFSGEVSVRAQ
ncbi:MAG: biotin--[acetyl-CoA-carboxylase] ligase [Erysipelotrichaceae bacterium]|nr:biotin--[acetyl-CoA-carboxylase] ligase [Erysipelotrichaceae bacterium]